MFLEILVSLYWIVLCRSKSGNWSINICTRLVPHSPELLTQPSIWVLCFCKVITYMPKLWFSVAIPPQTFNHLNKNLKKKKKFLYRWYRSWWLKQSYCLRLQIRPSACQREKKTHWVTLKLFTRVRNHFYAPELSHFPFALQGKQGTHPYCICSTGS